MKKLKKVFAVLLSVAMILGMSSTVFAEGTGTTPTKNDTQKATVQNVEAGATITAYRIVEPEYNNKGFLGYKNATGVTLADPLKPKSTEVTAIAKDTTLLNNLQRVDDFTYNTGTKAYTADLAPGYWVVVVTGSEKIYNPMLIGVYYSVSGSDNTLVSDPVDAGDNWKLETVDAYAKSAEPTVEKTVENPTYEVNQPIKFTVNADIPAYSEAYETVTYKLTDTLSSNLQYKQDTVVVTVDGGKYENADAVQFNEANNQMTITIDSATAIAKGGTKVVVTYQAELTDAAKEGLELAVTPSDNKVILEYSNDPRDTSSTKTKGDKTDHYTFGIDAKVSGKTENFFGDKTGEFVKVNEKGEISYSETESDLTKVETDEYGLKDAEFQLHKGSPDGELFVDGKGNDTFITAEDGRLTIVGLDSEVEYYLVESKAPEGYTINDTPVRVLINATLEDREETIKDAYNNEIKVTTKKLTGYTVSINNVKIDDNGNIETDEAGNIIVETGVELPYHYAEGVITWVENIDSTVKNPFNFKNTKLGALPSTGGIGTIIFTVGGCLIMVVAAALYFANRRRTANSENK